MSAVASSFKRPAGPVAGPSAKRSRPSTSTSTSSELPVDEHLDAEVDVDLDIEDHDLDETGEVDELTRAKVARKEARTIRNRESAQRSRNQRKAHLVWLEARVGELEAENRALRGDAPPPTTASRMGSSTYDSNTRENSPAQSVMSFANDLGIPPEIVSGSGGVNLASVAPPPADLDVLVEDVKPTLPLPTPTFAAPMTAPVVDNVTALHAENAALRERVVLLENLVKQVVALSNLSTVPAVPVQPVATNMTPVIEQEPAIDWDSLVQSHLPTQHDMGLGLNVGTVSTVGVGLSSTLSPSLFPSTGLHSPTMASLDLSLPISDSSSIEIPNTLARHPAAGEDTVGLRSEFGEEQGEAGPSGSRRGGFGQDQGVDRSLALASGAGPSWASTGTEQGDVVQIHGAAEGWGDAGEGWDKGMSELLEQLEGGAREAEMRAAATQTGVTGLEWMAQWGVEVDAV